jgi:glutamate-1-semialdehyde 2,1-aminomutase
MDFPRSHLAFARAKSLIPGGVNSPARAFGAVGGEPLFIERAQGAYLYDIDGHKLIDYIGSWGPMILGHAHPAVVDAIKSAAELGTSYGAPTERESELAQLIVDMVPSVEKVRLVNSGTEATMSALRLARGFTKRNLVIKFAGCYHGHVDSLLVAAGSSAATLGVPNSPGVTPGTTQDTIVLRYNDTEQFKQTMTERGSQIAAVILEPVVGNMGLVEPDKEFLAELRKLTEWHNTVLIFDEVMTGFRLAAGGAQELYGVTPDLTTLGKIVGGGLPVGAYGGRLDIMNHVLPAGKVFQAGTLSGNPLAMAAGIATLKLLHDDPPYAQLEKMAARLADGLDAAAGAAGYPHTVARVGSMLTLFFAPHKIRDWDTASKCDTQQFARYFWGLIERGVYMPCSQYEALFVSAAHSDRDIDHTISSAKETLLKMREENQAS